MSKEEEIDARYAALRAMTTKQLEMETGLKVPHAFMAKYYFVLDVLCREFLADEVEAAIERFQKSF